MNDKNFEIMDALLSFITQTDEWNYIQTHDPQILAAQKQWDETVDKIRAGVSDDMIDALEEAMLDYVTVRDDAAILYSLRVAIALIDAVNRPLELSQYVLDRIAFRKTEA